MGYSYEKESDRDYELERAEEIKAYRDQLETEESWLAHYEMKARLTKNNIERLKSKIINLGGNLPNTTN